MTGVGLDLLEIDRLAQALARRPRLAERLFTDGERAFAAERGEPARHLAVRFCAKEAVAKALALTDGDWHDVEVVGGGDSAPSVRLSGRAADARRGARRRGGDLAHPLQGHGRRGGDAAMSRSPWLEPLPDAAQMRAIDTWAIETKGIPSLELMERAGEGLARVVAEHVPAGRIAVVCGKGNNGGDGFVAARLLRQAGRDVDVLHDLGRAVAERATRARSCSGCRDRRRSRTSPRGSRRRTASSTRCSAPGRPARRRIRRRRDRGDERREGQGRRRRRARAASTRAPARCAGVAIRAAATATFHAAKPGLWIAPGKQHAGEVVVVPIGIPSGAPNDADVGLITPAVLADIPRRGAASTKFTSGNVVVIGGSRGLTGAPAMAAMAAMRAGAGYVTVAAPGSLELVVRGAPARGDVRAAARGRTARCRPRRSRRRSRRSRAPTRSCSGPGSGGRPARRRSCASSCSGSTSRSCIDADGLNALAGELESAAPPPLADGAHAARRASSGGCSRSTRPRSSARASTHARAAAARSRALVVLKGDDTLVAGPSGRVAVSRGGAPGARHGRHRRRALRRHRRDAGASGLSPAHAVGAAVYAHLRAGQIAAEPHGPDGVIASDVIAALPAALST